MTLTYRVCCTRVKDLIYCRLKKVLFIGYICLVNSEATQAELFRGKVQVCAHHALVQVFLTVRLGISMCQIFWEFPRNSFVFLRNSCQWDFGYWIVWLRNILWWMSFSQCFVIWGWDMCNYNEACIFIIYRDNLALDPYFNHSARLSFSYYTLCLRFPARMKKLLIAKS